MVIGNQKSRQSQAVMGDFHEPCSAPRPSAIRVRLQARLAVVRREKPGLKRTKI